MAPDKDAVVEDVRRVRRRLSKRLAEALKKGRLRQELRRVEREGDTWLRNGDEAAVRRNGGR